MTPDTPMDPSAQDAMADDWAQALEEQSQAASGGQEAPAFDAMDDAFAPINKPNSANDINMVLDIPVQLSVELGRTKVPIKYILPVWQEPRGTLEQKGDVDLDVILKVPVTLTLEVGRTRLPIRSLLQLNQGSVVELERGAGEALDVYVNGTLIAQGEVVVVNDKFGIRLTDIVTPSERLKRLSRG